MSQGLVLGSAGESSSGDEGVLFHLEKLFVTNDDNTNDVVDLSQNDTSEEEQEDEPPTTKSWGRY